MTRKAVNPEKYRVRLVGLDGHSVQAEGEVFQTVIENCNGIVRQGKYYSYVGFRDGGIATFEETSPPYVLTEF